MNTMRGFTLLELMIAVAILGILLTVAVPNIREMTASNRQLTVANELVATFNHARDAAITLSRDVQITANSNDWRKGWTVTALPYRAIAPDGTITDYPLDTLLSHGELSSQLELSATGFSYTYNRQGRLNVTSEVTIDVCDERSGEAGRKVLLHPIGKVSITPKSCS